MLVNFENRDWTLDLDELDVAQAMVIKVKTGYNLLQWQAELEQGDVLAAKALYWLMLSQNGVAADIDLINFKVIKFIAAVGKAALADNQTSEKDPTGGQPKSG